jgi:hypothetical protein
VTAPRALARAILSTSLLLAGCAAPDRAAGPGVPRLAESAATAGTVAGGVALDGAPLGRPGMTAWDSWASLVGGRGRHVMWFTDWSTGFQGYAVANAYARGATPVITWEMKNRQAAIRYSDVLAGKWDKYIDAWAAAARTDGRPVLLRFGHEMNGDWYGWSGARNGASDAAAAQFVATWRYVHARFARARAANVAWVWCPNHASVPDAAWNAPERYYPGDAYVDWTCADGYKLGHEPDGRDERLDLALADVRRAVRRRLPPRDRARAHEAVHARRVRLGRGGGDKAAWIRDAAARMEAAYPQLRAAVWFNYNKETDWRVESSPRRSRRSARRS